jgi:hypothetical protein
MTYLPIVIVHSFVAPIGSDTSSPAAQLDVNQASLAPPAVELATVVARWTPRLSRVATDPNQRCANPYGHGGLVWFVLHEGSDGLDLVP